VWQKDAMLLIDQCGGLRLGVLGAACQHECGADSQGIKHSRHALLRMGDDFSVAAASRGALDFGQATRAAFIGHPAHSSYAGHNQWFTIAGTASERGARRAERERVRPSLASCPINSLRSGRFISLKSFRSIEGATSSSRFPAEVDGVRVQGAIIAEALEDLAVPLPRTGRSAWGIQL
jgi:hypothetical protein